ncbi:hypothetical protein D6779_04425 [Candidatus Parcubacteria bacterium]|nr:MAG: hypothetical protein D6779_04425 [Candidatus Parcubacteria bacterium]
MKGVISHGKKIAVAAAIAGLLAGCATGPVKRSYTYDHSHSRAYNLVKASYLSGSIGLEDTKTGKEVYRPQGLAGMIMALGAFNYFSLDSGLVDAAATISTASTLKYPTQHPILAAWMPANGNLDDEERAIHDFEALVDRNIQKTADELGLQLGPKKDHKEVGVAKNFDEADGYTLYAQSVHDDKYCIKDGQCYILTYYFRPYPSQYSPSFLKEPTAPNNWWFQSWMTLDYQPLVFFAATAPKGGKPYPTKLFYEQFTSNMPGWSFVFMPEKQVIDENGQLLEYPVVFEKGEMLLFKKPAS